MPDPFDERESLFCLKLTRKEREMILSEAVLSPELEQRLRNAGMQQNEFVINLTADDLQELADAVAAGKTGRPGPKSAFSQIPAGKFRPKGSPVLSKVSAD